MAGIINHLAPGDDLTYMARLIGEGHPVVIAAPAALPVDFLIGELPDGRTITVNRRATREEFEDALMQTLPPDTPEETISTVRGALAQIRTPFYYALEMWDRVLPGKDGGPGLAVRFHFGRDRVQ